MPEFPFNVELIYIRYVRKQPPAQNTSENTQETANETRKPDLVAHRFWLQTLKLQFFPVELEEAIIRGDVQTVRLVLNSPAAMRQLAESIHIAALFGEVKIAELLKATESVNAICTTTSNIPNKICYNATPLNPPIGAKQNPMI